MSALRISPPTSVMILAHWDASSDCMLSKLHDRRSKFMCLQTASDFDPNPGEMVLCTAMNDWSIRSLDPLMTHPEAAKAIANTPEP